MKQKQLFPDHIDEQLLSLSEASTWASTRLNQDIHPENISYLIKYGRIKNHREAGKIAVSKVELENYYANSHLSRQEKWKKQLGDDLNWHLSFDSLREKDTTKHVHRIHPYKGKFIPQLVEYFLDNHTDEHKTNTYFQPDDLILDPFAGSGTTLIQANELGMHAVGIDISNFNTQLCNVKTRKHSFESVIRCLGDISVYMNSVSSDSRIQEFETVLQENLSSFNKRYFPSPAYKIDVSSGKINERVYSKRYESSFLETYYELANEFSIDCTVSPSGTYLEQWVNNFVLAEIELIRSQIAAISGEVHQRSN